MLVTLHPQCDQEFTTIIFDNRTLSSKITNCKRIFLYILVNQIIIEKTITFLELVVGCFEGP